MQIINHEGIPQNLPLDNKLIRGQSVVSRSEDYRLGWAWAKEQCQKYGPDGSATVRDTCDIEHKDDFDRGALAYMARNVGDA